VADLGEALKRRSADSLRSPPCSSYLWKPLFEFGAASHQLIVFAICNYWRIALMIKNVVLRDLVIKEG
jgi:hypothetical protein